MKARRSSSESREENGKKVCGQEGVIGQEEDTAVGGGEQGRGELGGLGWVWGGGGTGSNQQER